MIYINNKNTDYWLEQNKCPKCHKLLKSDTRFTDDAWGRPPESYKVKVCTYCDLEVGDYYN